MCFWCVLGSKYNDVLVYVLRGRINKEYMERSQVSYMAQPVFVFLASMLVFAFTITPSLNSLLHVKFECKSVVD